MIDKDMVMVCVLARLQAENKTPNQLSSDDLGKLIAEAIADLRLADDLASARR